MLSIFRLKLTVEGVQKSSGMDWAGLVDKDAQFRCIQGLRFRVNLGLGAELLSSADAKQVGSEKLGFGVEGLGRFFGLEFTVLD